MDNIKSNLKGVIGSAANGIQLNQLSNDYFNVIRSKLDFQSLGFTSLRKLIESMPDVVRIVETSGHPVVKLALKNSDPPCLKNLMTLVHTDGLRKKERSRIGRMNQNGHRNGYGHHSLPLSITVPSDSRGFNVPLREPERTKGSIDKIDTSTTMTAQSDNLFDSGTWLARPTISYEAFEKQVYVLGVQSGYAVVVGGLPDDACDLLESKNLRTVFPGDMALWQPLFRNNYRAKNQVDLTTVFPVTVIKRVNREKINVRVLGLVTVIDVAFVDLFELPSTSDKLCRLVSQMLMREATLVPLALVPPSTDIWYADDVLGGRYTVLFSIDEGGCLLESCDRRGQFLNVSIFQYLRTSLVNSDSASKDDKWSFYQHMADCIDRSVDALRPTFKKLLSLHTDVHPARHPLCPIYDPRECTDRMLLGCKRLMVSGADDASAMDPATDASAMIVHRMQASGANAMTFFNIDDLTADIEGKDEAPVPGVYIVDDKFVGSSAIGYDALRFRTALLLTIPSLIDLTADLGLGHS